jgi:hypothetical protein
MITTFIENFKQKFDKEPFLKDIECIADLISWNVWQMDGFKGVIPDSCTDVIKVYEDLFGNKSEEIQECKGCKTNNILSHNGVYCIIMNWIEKDPVTRIIGRTIRFVDLLNK